MNDSIEAPRDSKQVRNVRYQNSQKEKERKGYKNNLADENLECISAVDTHDFVQHWSKSKGRMPNFVCYTGDQRDDLKFFLSQNTLYPIGVDRTFNLGKFFVTALVYNNLRVVRSDDSSEHPLFIGPVFIHRDSNYEAYNYFFSSIKASLCSSDTIYTFELKLNCDILIGSNEEKALTKAIDSVFPSSIRFLCTKHLKDGTSAYLQKEVGVPQKDRTEICKAIFGEEGLVNTDDSISFDKMLKDVLVKASKYLNNIMKSDANWKVKSTPELIDMLHELTVLHFKDFRRALKEEGDYRIHGKYKKYMIKKNAWRNLDTEGRRRKFVEFLQNKKSAPKESVVKSTYSKFIVPDIKNCEKNPANVRESNLPKP